jgi:hypothetical protein
MGCRYLLQLMAADGIAVMVYAWCTLVNFGVDDEAELHNERNHRFDSK